MAALSAVAVLACVRRLLGHRTGADAQARVGRTDVALVAALAYALCTPVWSTASQAMWSHTPTVLGYSVALWGLTWIARATRWRRRDCDRPGLDRPRGPATASAAALLVVFMWSRRGARAWRSGETLDGARIREAATSVRLWRLPCPCWAWPTTSGCSVILAAGPRLAASGSCRLTARRCGRNASKTEGDELRADGKGGAAAAGGD